MREKSHCTFGSKVHPLPLCRQLPAVLLVQSVTKQGECSSLSFPVFLLFGLILHSFFKHYSPLDAWKVH